MSMVGRGSIMRRVRYSCARAGKNGEAEMRPEKECGQAHSSLQVIIAVNHEGVGNARPAGPAAAANPVHILRHLRGRVVLHYPIHCR